MPSKLIFCGSKGKYMVETGEKGKMYIFAPLVHLYTTTWTPNLFSQERTKKTRGLFRVLQPRGRKQGGGGLSFLPPLIKAYFDRPPPPFFSFSYEQKRIERGKKLAVKAHKPLISTCCSSLAPTSSNTYCTALFSFLSPLGTAKWGFLLAWAFRWLYDDFERKIMPKNIIFLSKSSYKWLVTSTVCSNC